MDVSIFVQHTRGYALLAPCLRVFFLVCLPSVSAPVVLVYVALLLAIHLLSVLVLSFLSWGAWYIGLKATWGHVVLRLFVPGPRLLPV